MIIQCGKHFEAGRQENRPTDMYRLTDRWKDRHTHKQLDRQINRQIDKHTDRWTERQRQAETNGQTDEHINTEKQRMTDNNQTYRHTGNYRQAVGQMDRKTHTGRNRRADR